MAGRTATIKVDDHELRERMDQLEAAGSDLRKIWRRFYQYMRVQTALTWRNLRTGGEFRGVTWKYFAPQYTRKTDGVTVQAWGGVPKIRGSGMVKGRIRRRSLGGGMVRLAQGDALMDSTGTLKAQAAGSVFVMNSNRLRFGTNLQYARRQAELRPFLFFTRNDRDRLRQMVLEYVEGE